MECEDEIKYPQSTEQEQISFLTQENAQLKQNIIKLNEQLINNQANNQNLDELFYKSKVYAELQNQCQLVINQNVYLKQKLNKLRGSLDNLEAFRLQEINEIINKENEEKEKLEKEISKLKLESAIKQNSKQLDKDSQVDNKNYAQQIMQNNEKQNENIESLTKEKQNIIVMMKSYQQKASELDIKVHQLTDKNNSLVQIFINLYDNFVQEVEVTSLQHQIPNAINYETITFRHGRYKLVQYQQTLIREIIVILHDLVKKYHESAKAKFDDLVGYLKGREQKINILEAKVKSENSEIQNAKSQIEQLINEVELTGQNYEDLLQKNKELLGQIKDLEEKLQQKSTEWFSEKQELKQQHSSLQIKSNADKEVFTQLNNLNQELQQKMQNYSLDLNQCKDSLNKQMEINEQKTKNYENLINRLKMKDNEIQLANGKLNELHIIINKQLQEQEELKLTIKEKDFLINEKLNSIRLIQKEIKHWSLIDACLLKLEVSRYQVFQSIQQLFICPLCKKNHGCMFQIKCGHLICKYCWDEALYHQPTKTICPYCKVKGDEPAKEVSQAQIKEESI